MTELEKIAQEQEQLKRMAVRIEYLCKNPVVKLLLDKEKKYNPNITIKEQYYFVKNMTFGSAYSHNSTLSSQMG